MKAVTLSRSDDLGAMNSDAKAVATGLSKALADSFALYMKTLNYHWNVEGSKFLAVHKLTEEHYLNMAAAIDEVAERIRMLGYYAPGSFSDFASLTTIEEAPADGLAQEKMIAQLEKDHMTVASHIKEVISVAEKNGDSTTADLLSGRRNFHEQAAWMFRSLQK